MNYLLVGSSFLLVIYFILRYVILSNKSNQTKRPIIIDVRSNIEWIQWHHPDAIHIPYWNIENVILNYNIEKSEPIIIYCSTKRRATYASQRLQSLGYSNIQIKTIKELQ